MKKHSLLFTFICTSIFAFIGCTKEKGSPNIDNVNNLSSGQLHNLILDAVAKNSDLTTINVDKEFKIINTLVEKYTKINLDNIDNVKLFKEIQSTSSKQKGICGSYTEDVMKELYSSKSSLEFFKKIEKIETQIKEDLNLNYNERFVFINSLSIWKYSTAYWEDAVLNPKNEWHSFYTKKVLLENAQRLDNSVASVQAPGTSCTGVSNAWAYIACVASIDSQAYSNTYWARYTEYPDGTNNAATAASVAESQATYSSGLAMGAGGH